MMLHTKYQGSRPCGFRLEDFFMFLPILVYVNHVTPGGHFWPQGHNLNKLVRGLQGDAIYKYQSSRPYGFRQEYFFMFLPIKAYVKHVIPGA